MVRPVPTRAWIGGVAPRPLCTMPRMAPTYTSARFVGREDAFERLASVLQSAATGAAGALFIDGTAGVGSTRFIDEAIRRVGGLQEPMTILRGGAFGPRTDAPYGAIVRALRPVLRELSDEEAASVLGSAADELRRLLPDVAERLDRRQDGERRVLTVVPERRQARLLEGILG